MKKSEMTDIQKANYEYMRSLGIEKSWAERIVAEYGDLPWCRTSGGNIEVVVISFARWVKTEEGRGFWSAVHKNADDLLLTKTYHQALLEIPNNLVKKSE